ncbi:MAG TPA: hypothetical protein VGF59_14530 [Bryobacteraceae bacterium]|jgi:hypothetical protein
MNSMNQMQQKLLWALRSIVDTWELQWIEIPHSSSAGTVRLMRPESFRTLLKFEYEFEPERFRLLIYRDGRHIAGRCNIDYDNGDAIEQILAEFRARGTGGPPVTPTPGILPVHVAQPATVRNHPVARAPRPWVVYSRLKFTHL